MSKSIFSARHFNDEAAAYAFVERHLWADGRVCPHCGVIDRSGPLQGKSTRVGVYKCYACRKPFTVKLGTIFEASHIAMRDWLAAIHMICSSKKGISANQLHRTLGITLKSAWFLSHRIREAMAPAANAGPIGGEGKIVETDETEISLSRKSRPRPRVHNPKIVSLVERGGQVRSRRITVVRSMRHAVRDVVREELDPASTLHTDGAAWYAMQPALAAKHETINHEQKIYARDNEDGERVHTNSAEGYFSIFKRGLVGTYQHMSEQHLPRYLAEFDFRMNNRARLGVNDEARTVKALKGATGKRLTYRTTGGQASGA